MKTEQEILDFYGVEYGRVYKITNVKPGRDKRYIGKTFWIRDYHTVVISTKTGLKIYENTFSLIGDLTDFEYKEIKKLVLDEKEKRYLSAALKPFKNRIVSVRKFSTRDNMSQFIYVALKESNDYLSFPFFEAETMYKGMEENRAYSLDELELYK